MLKISYHLIIMSLAVMLVAACVSIPKLQVKYQLPPSTEPLSGQEVILVIEDSRPAKQLIGKGAEEEFKHFPGNLSVSVARSGEPGFMVGLFPPMEMMEELFKRRLEHLGATVLPKSAPGGARLNIGVKELLLDLVDRKWVATVNYEARLVEKGRLLAGETITGKAERLKIVGRKGADEVMSEIITDTVNRLDLVRLFERAHRSKAEVRGRRLRVSQAHGLRPPEVSRGKECLRIRLPI